MLICFFSTSLICVVAGPGFYVSKAGHAEEMSWLIPPILAGSSDLVFEDLLPHW